MITLDTQHLRLIACPADAARALAWSQGETVVLGLRVHPDYPGSDIRGWLPFHADRLDADPTLDGWGMWLLVHRADGVIFGDAGFKGKPDTSGTVDIGYGIVGGYRRRGYTTEAALALRDWALAQPGVRRITGDCLPENVASARILQRLGMRYVGMSEDGLAQYELLNPHTQGETR